MKLILYVFIIFGIGITQNLDNRNTYSLGDNFNYSEWQTASNQGDIELLCPDSSIAVGYEGRTGAWMDKFRLICKHLNSDGTLGEISFTDWNGGSDGGSEFGPYILDGNQGLVGIQANISTWSTTHLASIQGYGQSIENIGNELENNIGYSFLTWLGPTQNGILNIGTVWIPIGNVIVGMVVPSQNGYVQGNQWIYRELLLNAGPSVPGDVNNDGITNLLDILVIVNMILNMSEFDPFADVNGDFTISISDIIALVTIILS